MYALVATQHLRRSVEERQQQAQARNLATRLALARKWERRAASATRRAQLARSAC